MNSNNYFLSPYNLLVKVSNWKNLFLPVAVLLLLFELIDELIKPLNVDKIFEVFLLAFKFEFLTGIISFLFISLYFAAYSEIRLLIKNI